MWMSRVTTIRRRSENLLGSNGGEGICMAIGYAYHRHVDRSSAMKCRDKHDLISMLQLVLQSALQLPIRIVHQNQYSWSPTRQPAPIQPLSRLTPYRRR